jgi:YidC/Oxa1 family membrane protein insertase
MEKRVLIAVILSIAVMYGYSVLFPPPPKIQPAEQSLITSPQETQQALVKTGQPVEPSVVAQPAGLTSTTSDVEVDTDLFTAVFSPQGAALKRLTLKKYNDKAGTEGKAIVLLNEINQNAFTLVTDYSGLSVATPATYLPSVQKLSVTGADSKTLDFTAVLPNGVTLVKRFSFSGSNYAIQLENIIRNKSTVPIEGSFNTLLRDRSEKPKEDAGRFEVFGPATLTESGVTFDSVADLTKAEKTYTTAVKWTGFGDKYFMGALLAKASSIHSVTLKNSAGFIEQKVLSPKISLSPGTETVVAYTLYYGPKDIDIMKAQGEGLEAAIDLGWFAIIAKPLLHSLKLLYGYLHNYGLAIIVITVILKIFFFPLTHKSYKSMKEMQKLQPKMQELKEKFKDDKDGLNRSVMELYKTHKVNPLGGCLPMIVQIPVFFGLYKALMFSIELRHAPFYFWLQDLSAKDPYYVTPIIMGVTMFIQQKMTPTNMDPMQAKMMLALPLVFTAMFLNFPSGLVLYWLVNNILTIAQQMYINRSLKEA